MIAATNFIDWHLEVQCSCPTGLNFSRLNGSMIVSHRTIRRIGSAENSSAVNLRVRSLPLFGAVLFAAVAASQPALCHGPHLWTPSRAEDFEKGTPQGVAVTSNGHLREGPGLSELLTTPSTYVWSVALDKLGTTYLGTASPATVLRVGQDGKPFTLFETKDLSVQVVRLGPDGALYVATLPSGKVYQLKPDASAKQDESSAKVVFDAAKLDDATANDGRTAAEKSADKSAEKSEAKSHY